MSEPLIQDAAADLYRNMRRLMYDRARLLEQFFDHSYDLAIVTPPRRGLGRGPGPDWFMGLPVYVGNVPRPVIGLMPVAADLVSGVVSSRDTEPE